MRFALKTTSREEFISLSHRLACALQAIKTDRPWMIHIDAAYNSGKSLIALGIDQAFNPERYPAQLPPDINADFMLNPDWNGKKELSVIFQNFNLLQPEYPLEQVLNINNPRPFCYQDCIKILEDLNPEARVMIGSNLSAAAADFNFSANDSLPEGIDMNINVYKLWGGFNRKLVINVDSEALIEQMSLIAEDYKDNLDPSNLLADFKERMSRIKSKTFDFQ